MSHLNLKSTVFSILFIALVTAFVSEIKIMPFDNAPFRFGLGSIAFFLAILIQPMPILWTGVITGVTVILFRTSIDTFYFQHTFLQAFIEHFPAACFYICFAICLSMIDLNKLKTKPLALGLFGALFEIIANFIEQLTYTLLQIHSIVMTESILLLFAVAFLRSFFVVGLYSAISIQEQKKQLEHLLAVNSELYVEALYLQKSMDQIETLTADSFQLYKQLKQTDRAASFEALRLSQEIHELKKDAARLYAGLSQIVTTQKSELYEIATLLQYVTIANKKYSALLKKEIAITVEYHGSWHTNKQLPILAILNNIVTNAVEAIEHSGKIQIVVQQQQNDLQLIISNNGPTIDSNILPVIFEPGYTSKFKDDGFASTGIGLSHVHAATMQLGGTIYAESDKETIFIITIPLKNLT